MRDATKFNWSGGLFLIIYQALLLVALPLYFYYYSVSLYTILAAFLFFFLGGFSITGGYHRLFAHKSYKTHPVIQAIYLFFGSTTIQGSALRWCHDHRLHHAFVDTERDPYTITKGFWYAHFLWMMEQPKEIDPKIVPDLMNNKMVMFQHRYEVLCMFGSNFLMWLLMGTLLNDFMGVFVIAIWLRLFVLHHCTWFINSLAHTWGDQPFSQEHTAVNNWIISLLTFGEGYHNYHHTFANDYRNGVRWYQLDPTKWIIWTLNKLGLAEGLKSVDMATIEKKIVIEHKHLLQDKIKDLWYVKKEELENKIQEISERLLSETSKFSELKEKYEALKQSTHDHAAVVQLKQEIDQLKAKIKQDWRAWSHLSSQILHLKPIKV